MTEQIGDWLCADVDGLRVASHGPESASYDVEDEVFVSHGRVPKAVVEWLIRPTDSTRVTDAGKAMDDFVVGQKKPPTAESESER